MSTDNVSTANPSTDIYNSRSMELGRVSHNISTSIQNQNHDQIHENEILHHSQDQTYHHNGSGPRVIPLN